MKDSIRVSISERQLKATKDSSGVQSSADVSPIAYVVMRRYHGDLNYS